MTDLPDFIVEEAVARALKEDLGDAGDITSAAVIPANARASAVITARREGVVAGLAPARAAFRLLDGAITLDTRKTDGAAVKPGEAILSIEGPARLILSAERVALNFMGHLSGVATATAALVRAAQGTGARIVCTRKTTPGLRAFEKHAVRCGGGYNHRFGLYDAAMIKDNHIAASGGVTKALKAARAALGHMVKIEIEVDTLEQLEEALQAGADVILLDNMAPERLREAVKINAGRATLEASGNVTPDNVRAIAETGVDCISSGWITHSAPNLDLGLDFL